MSRTPRGLADDFPGSAARLHQLKTPDPRCLRLRLKDRMQAALKSGSGRPATAAGRAGG